MSTYTLPDLLNQWQRGEMTAEQAIGVRRLTAIRIVRASHCDKGSSKS